MASYQYRPLRREEDEIRLVHLLPSNYVGDPIKLRISHASFQLPSGRSSAKATIQVDALRELVSWPWTLEEIEGGGFVGFNVIDGVTRPLSDLTGSWSVGSEETLELSDKLERLDTSDGSETSSISEEPESNRPHYEALSYTWGDPDAAGGTVAEVDDPSAVDKATAELPLRANLSTALRHLRDTEDERILWIDAICINQDDVEERNEQVKRMTHIYTHSQRVIAWLGEESADSKHAMDTLRHVAQQLESTKSGRIIASVAATERWLWRNDQPVAFDQPTWTALQNMVQRAWFYRLWCWQEIKLGGWGAVLQCGHDTIPWDDFWLAILCLHNKTSTPSMLFRERCRHIAFLKHDAALNSMANILDICRSKGCVDPRDKIYGILGLAPPQFSGRINVNYRLPVEDVYKEAFLSHSEMTHRLELLKHCDLANRNIGGPSWVPDWSKTEFAAPILNNQMATGISRAWFAYYSGDDVLEVAGTLQTTIKTVSTAASKLPNETLLAARQWHAQLPSTKKYLTDESIEQAFALTLCMNRTREQHPYDHFLSATEWVGVLRRMLRLTAASSSNDPIYKERETANTIQKMRGRRFFTTSDGHIGIAPAGAQVGETISISS